MSGDVYAVDDETMMLHNFVYDGNGKDTFFWAGSSNRPSSKGYIVPDKNGRTNVLGRQVRTRQCHPFYCRQPFSSFLVSCIPHCLSLCLVLCAGISMKISY